MKHVFFCMLIFMSLPIFADRLEKEFFYFANESDIAVYRQYYYDKAGNLEKIKQINDDSGIRTDYKYDKKLLTEAKEYNDDVLISKTVFLYKEKEKMPYRREIYDSFGKLTSYSLFTFQANDKNPLSIETYNADNKLSERMVFIYTDNYLSEIQIFDDKNELQLCRKQIIDKQKNAVTEEIIFKDKIISTVKREFSSSRKSGNKIFSLPDNFFDFK